MFDDNVDYCLDEAYHPEYDKLPSGDILPYIMPRINHENAESMEHLKEIRIGRLEKLAKYLREKDLKYSFNFGVIYRWNVRTQQFEGDAIAHAVDLFPQVLELVTVDSNGYYKNVMFVGEKSFHNDSLNHALYAAEKCFGLTPTLTAALFIPYHQQSDYVLNYYPGLELRVLNEKADPIEVAENITSVCRYAKEWKKNNQ